MTPDYRKSLKHIESEKKNEVKISKEDKKILEKFSEKGELELLHEQRTVLGILTKRKTVNMVTREYNLALKPLGKELITKDKILEILKELKSRELVKSVIGADGQDYWVDKNYFRK
ncbi:MAG: hypothetical protein ACFFD2_00220 [Promethearchaeota archaeon]